MKLEMTGRYIKEIPEAVRATVDGMDRELCQSMEQEGTSVFPSDDAGANPLSIPVN